MLINTKVELLAPAGSLQSFFAAIEYGADAVFCGLTSFSARAKATNFSLEELELLVSYAHKHNKKIYVALNTLLKTAEFQELIDILEAIETLGVDGLIIQDFGLYRLAHTHFPDIPLHASTQMLVHNLAGVRVLEGLGFERVVLARELSLAEISHISENSNLEIEHFIHGALCYSMSGHCLFSSYVDGKSGNRGRCTQPCRRRYSSGKETSFFFSTMDFSAIELIPDLIKAGVMSLKIEGRMKSAEHVAAVVSAYRTVLDSQPGEEQNGIEKAKRQLESAMGRKSTPGFLPGHGGADILLPKIKGGIGKIIGRVERIQGGRIAFKSNDVLHVGDRLRIQPVTDRAGQGFTVRSIILGKKECKVAGAGSFVTIPLPMGSPRNRAVRVGLDDRIFKVATGRMFTLSVEACRRKLRTAPGSVNDVSLYIECDDVLSSLKVQGRVHGLFFQKSYEVKMIPATRTPLSYEILLKIFSHSSISSLDFAELKHGELPAVVIKPSRLKAIRRDFYGELEGLLEDALHKLKKSRKHRVLAALTPQASSGDEKGEEHDPKQLYIVSDRVSDLDYLGDNPEIRFIFPLKPEFLDACSFPGSNASFGVQVIWDLPSVCFDGNWNSLKEVIKKAIDLGFSAFRLNNIGQFALFSSHKKSELMAGPWLYSLNSEAVQFLAELGCSTMCLSIEDDRKNMEKLIHDTRANALLATVYGRVDLFTSRIVRGGNGGQTTLRNDQGQKFSLHEHQGITLTTAEAPFSLLGKCEELHNMGLYNFILDLRGVGFGTSAGQDIVAAFWDDRPLTGTMDMNFRRGLL